MGGFRVPLAAWLACGAALSLGPSLARAQDPAPAAEPPPADPLPPLDPFEDLGLDWPDPAGSADPDDRLPLDGVPEDAAPEPTPAPEPGAISYTLEVVGLPAPVDESVRAAFADLSNLDNSDAAETAGQVDRRASADAEILAELLRAEGYYGVVVVPRTRGSANRISVRLEVEAGTRYRFAEIALPGIEAVGAEEASALRAILGLKVGDPVRAAEVIAARGRLAEQLGRRGYALAVLGEQRIEVDHDSHSARFLLPVDPGIAARFGAIRVLGAPPFPDSHVAHLARFSPGDTYDAALVGDLRRALIQTGLVGEIAIAEVVAPDGRVDLEITLEPAPPRTIAGEVGYGTGEGARVEASWTHRNFFNPEGALTLAGVLGTQEQVAAISFRRNNWKQRDRILTAQLIAGHSEVDAYEARYVGAGAGVERVTNFLWQKPWVWSLEGELLATDERDRLEDVDLTFTRAYFIAALAGALRYDGSDSLLDPTSGFRLGGSLAPELSVELDTLTLGDERVEAGARETYLRAMLDGSAYLPVGEALVVAGRARIGTLLGADRGNIAPSRRLYAGGGGSVRGYGYQQLGPKDIAGDPIGGRSLTEFALEARYRFGADRQFGIVPFLDGGRLSEGAWPGTRGWQFGIGVGARYYSSFGPIRIDVGTPLNRQQGDSRIAVVVGLGQAF